MPWAKGDKEARVVEKKEDWGGPKNSRHTQRVMATNQALDCNASNGYRKKVFEA